MDLKRGINIEHWLNELDRPRAEQVYGFDAEDARRVADLGFDHVRMNVNEQHLWDAEGRRIAQAFDTVDAMLDACAELGLKVVFDLHILRSHHFNARERPLFGGAKHVDGFLAIWRELADWLGHRSIDRLAYEFLNEPVADDPADWNRVYRVVYRMLREREPERPLVLGSNLWSRPETFAELEIPADDHMILTFHLYRPMLVSHHAIKGRPDGFYSGPVCYPGQPVPDEALAAMTSEERAAVEGVGNHVHDRDVLAGYMDHAQCVARERGMPLYCGEFGCFHTVDQSIRLRWAGDMVALLEERGIGWAAYSYSGAWPMVWTGADVDREMLASLGLLG